MTKTMEPKEFETPRAPKGVQNAVERFQRWWIKPRSETAAVTIDPSGHAEIALLFDRPESTAPVAVLKRLGQKGDQERFKREVAITRDLYSGELFLLASEDHEQEHWMVLRYLAGGSLRQRLQSKQFFCTCNELLQKIAVRVDRHLHVSILHRDLKPENIMFASLEDDDVIYVIDYGVAVHAGAVGYATAAPDHCRLGTSKYMAPERRNDNAFASAQTEIYEFAIVAAELAIALGNDGLAAALSKLTPDSKHGFLTACQLLESAIASLDKDPDAALKQSFRAGMKALFDLCGALNGWHHRDQSDHAAMMLARGNELLLQSVNLGITLANFVRGELCDPLVNDLQKFQFELDKKGKARAQEALLRCMECAISLCIEPQQRTRLADFNKRLKDVQSPVKSLGAQVELPVRTRESAEIAVSGVKRSGKAGNASKDIPDVAEAGVGNDARNKFLNAVIALLSLSDPLRSSKINSDNDYRRWRGILMDLRSGNKAKTMFVSADDTTPQVEQKLLWLDEFGVVVVKLTGAQEGFWLLDEDQLVALVQGFLDDLEKGLS